MSIRYHGKYCGPGWSAGEYQQSVKSAVPPDDEFDATCKEHDGAYAHPANSKARSKADDKFFRENIGNGPKRTLAALAVKATSKMMRAQENNPQGQRFRKESKAKGAKHLRGAQPSPIKGKSAVSRARARLNQRHLTTQQGQLINSITNNKLIKVTQPTTTQYTMPRNNKYKTNNKISKAAVAVSKTVRMSKPKFKSTNGGTMISHREFVAPVYSSVLGNFDTISCNPGLDTAFPWLSAIAGGYERYRFHKLEYTYVSAAATSERGRVGLAYQYDPTAPSPVSRSEFFNIVPNVEEAPWEDMVLRVKPITELRFIRNELPFSGTLNTYDCGKAQILTAMNADNTTQLGELFVEYTVQLENPQFNQSAVSGSMSIGGETATNPFGTSASVVSGQPILSWNSGVTMKMNTSTPLIITINIVGTGLAQTIATLTLGSGSNGTIGTINNLVNTAGTAQTMIVSTKYTQPDDLLTLISGESTTISAVAIFIGKYTES
jgi:hypothetical protein